MGPREEIIEELYKPARKNFTRRKIIVKGFFETLSVDLAEMTPYSRENQGNKYILCAIDNLSKYAFCQPLQNKSGPEVAEKMGIILSQCPSKVKFIHSDQGKEFFCRPFKRLMKKWKINHYNSFTHLKASICERFIRTLKGKLYFTFAMRGNHKWVDVLQDTVKKYNETKHRTIKMAPADVNEINAQQLLNTVFKHPERDSRNHPKFKIGDYVRLSRVKQMFEKGYTPNYTVEIFQVGSIVNSNPPVYRLKDMYGALIRGAFYAEELQKTKHPKTFLVEKILQRKKDKVKVKWLYFPEKDNSWEDAKNIV